METIEQSDIKIDYKSLENNLNYLLTRLFVSGKASKNSKIEVTFEPKVKVVNAVDNKIIENVYTLEDI